MVVRACHPSTLEVETGGSQVCHVQLHSQPGLPETLPHAPLPSPMEFLFGSFGKHHRRMPHVHQGSFISK